MLMDFSVGAIESRLDIIRCPNCLGTLELQDEILICVRCCKSFGISNGIPILQEKSVYYGEFTPSVIYTLLAHAELDFDRALSKCLREQRAPGRLGEYILGLGRAGWKFLLPIFAEARALDLGCGWGAIAYSLAANCREVVAADACIERMSLLKLRTIKNGLSNVFCVCTGTARHLPFRDQSFDIVVLNGVLEWIPPPESDDPRECQRAFLEEVARVLKPHGCLWLAIENRSAWRTWFLYPDGHTGLRFVPWLPRRVANLYSRLVKSKRYTNYLYTRRSLINLLRDAGFSRAQFYVPLPGYHHPTSIIPLSDKPTLKALAKRPANTFIRRLKNWIRSELVARFPDSFMVLASKTERDDPVAFLASLCEKIADELRVEIPSEKFDLYRINGEMGMVTAIFSMKNRGYVIKLPLHLRGRKGLEKEIMYFHPDQLSTSPLRDLATKLPRPLGSGEYDRQYYAVFEKSPGKALSQFDLSRRWETRLVREALIFATDLHKASTTSVDNWTCFVEQLLSEHVNLVRELCDSESKQRVLDRIAEFLRDRLTRWPRTTVIGHGDFKLANCLFDSQGRLTTVLDWGAGLQPEIVGYDLSFLLLDWEWHSRSISLAQCLLDWLNLPAKDTTAIKLLRESLLEIGIPLADDWLRTLVAYQWLRRMSPLGTGYEARRFDYNYVDQMFDVVERVF